LSFEKRTDYSGGGFREKHIESVNFVCIGKPSDFFGEIGVEEFALLVDGDQRNVVRVSILGGKGFVVRNGQIRLAQFSKDFV